MALQTDEPKWHRLCADLDEKLVMEHYQDPTFATQLRMYAEMVYGKPVAGRSLARVWQEMSFQEVLQYSFVETMKKKS